MVAVFHRTSFGVAGLAAAERFDASASNLSLFVVVQLIVYAGLQVPVGVMLDRFGSRRLILAGAALMIVGQLTLALAGNLPVAVLARVLVGAGDAMTFISVLRLIPAWFPSRRVPMLTQMTGLTGQLGQIASAIPLVALLHGPGWTFSYVAAAAVGLLVAVLVFVVLHDAPDRPQPAARTSFAGIRRQLVDVWAHPGTQLGFWSHFTTAFSSMVFALMWGYPFLVAGQGLSPATASALMTGFVICGMVSGPVLGRVIARHPLRRSWLVLGLVSATVAIWAAVLVPPGRAPLWLLAGLVVVLALGGPCSMIGFDYARTFVPSARLGSATGIVNVGGFTAALVTILLVGILLDVSASGTGGYQAEDFRIALAAQVLPWSIGVVGILRARRRVRRVRADEGVVVPRLRDALARDWERRRSGRE